MTKWYFYSLSLTSDVETLKEPCICMDFTKRVRQLLRLSHKDTRLSFRCIPPFRHVDANIAL